MPMALHAAAEHGAVEDVEGGEQRGGAIALVIGYQSHVSIDRGFGFIRKWRIVLKK